MAKIDGKLQPNYLKQNALKLRYERKIKQPKTKTTNRKTTIKKQNRAEIL